MALTEDHIRKEAAAIMEAGFKLVGDPEAKFRLSADGSVAALSIPTVAKSEKAAHMALMLVVSEKPWPVEDALMRFGLWCDQLMEDKP